VVRQAHHERLSEQHWEQTTVCYILACEGDAKWVFFDGNYQEVRSEQGEALG
jgi:hypothetical protein